MVYRAIGLMSGSSLDGLDIAFVQFHENGGKWEFEVLQADCYVYTNEWVQKLKNATLLSALDYQLLHTAYGDYLGEQVNKFIVEHQLHYQVALIASHGHTSFHLPAQKMTAQLGDGAAIAAATKLPVVSDLRNLDLALGGQGAPIVPIAEKLLWGNNNYFLNLGGIANLSINGEKYMAFDVCPANRVLNMLAETTGKTFDENGDMAKSGLIDEALLKKLNELDYYQRKAPKSLANDFGTQVVFSIIKEAGISIENALRTMTEHIVQQLSKALNETVLTLDAASLFVTGGGAFNEFLMIRIREELQKKKIDVLVPDKIIVSYKEAIAMALMGVLRWRQEHNVLSSVTGAKRDSVAGALWMGDV